MSLASIVQYRLSTYTDSSYLRPGNYSVFSYEAEGDGVHDRQTPHRHDFYQLIWLTEGNGRLVCDLKEWDFEAGTLFFAAPGRLHCWKPETPARGIALGFTDEFLCAETDRPSALGRFAYLHEAEKPLLPLTGQERVEMNGLFGSLLNEAAQNEPGRDDVVRAYLMIVLAKARRWLLRQTGTVSGARTANSLSLRFRQALEDHFPRLLKVSDYARLLHASRTQLNHDLRQHTGHTASEHIHNRILLEAKRLLMYSNATVSEIAYQLRFQDPSYFCRFFRRHTGQPPGEFRSSNQVQRVAC